MGFFKEIAVPLLERGVPLIPLRPKSKVAFLDDWASLATTNLEQIEQWDILYPDANCGVVAKAVSGAICIFEIDNVSVQQKIREETGQSLPSTYAIRSSIGKGHYYLRHSAKSILVGNLSADDEDGKELWSFRADNQYVVSAKSLHPRTGEPYEVRSTAPIAEVPDWLLDWMKSQKKEKKKALTADGEEIWGEGSRNKQLTSLAGRLRYIGLCREEMEASLMKINDVRCDPPLSEEEVKTICGSVSRYETGARDQVLLGGKPLGQTAYGVEPAKPSVVELVTPPDIKIIPYPKFPEWVFSETSLFEGLVKPLCDQNSRHPEFQWMPAMVLLLNYLGGRVRIEFKPYQPSIFMVSIGRRGRLFKSACVRDAFKYFEYAGMLGWGDAQTRNAEGRIVVITPGSGEGLGKEIMRMGAKNFVIFYDELTALTQKASIESSSLTGILLSIYEGQGLQNAVKATKDSYSLRDGEYCGSLIACCTDKNFLFNWSKLAGKSTGLDDRFFFLYQPEVFKELTEYKHAYTQESSIKTRQLVDKAVAQGLYAIADTSPLKKFFKENQDSSRAGIRVEKFALGFAVDLGLDIIDEDCLERSLALINYEKSVKKYLELYEASTREGAIQMEIIHTVQRSQGRMNSRDLERVMHPERLGSSLWQQSYYGLIKTGWIREEGTGTRGDPKTIVLLRVPEEDD